MIRVFVDKLTKESKIGIHTGEKWVSAAITPAGGADNITIPGYRSAWIALTCVFTTYSGFTFHYQARSFYSNVRLSSIGEIICHQWNLA